MLYCIQRTGSILHKLPQRYRVTKSQFIANDARAATQLVSESNEAASPGEALVHEEYLPITGSSPEPVRQPLC
jgi:hypothetical protein